MYVYCIDYGRSYMYVYIYEYGIYDSVICDVAYDLLAVILF